MHKLTRLSSHNTTIHVPVCSTLIDRPKVKSEEKIATKLQHTYQNLVMISHERFRSQETSKDAFC